MPLPCDTCGTVNGSKNMHECKLRKRFDHGAFVDQNDEERAEINAKLDTVLRGKR